jgi:putative methanogenesis marker protein 17
MIEVSSDDAGMKEKYSVLAKEMLAASGIRSVEDLRIVAMMKKGFFIISVRFRDSPPPARLASMGDFEPAGEGAIFHLDPARESQLPSILNLLRQTFGSRQVSPLSRFDIKVEQASTEELKRLIVVDHEETVVENALPAIVSIIPEGFRTMKTLRTGNVLTVLGAERELATAWIEEMEVIHEAWNSRHND